MTHQVTLIYGDGIGPEVIGSTVEVIKACDVDIKWHEKPLGLNAYMKEGDAIPQQTIDSIKNTKVALKGPTTTPVGKGYQSANVRLRKALDLYACIRPIKSIPGLELRYKDVDLVVVRENTEGLYSGEEEVMSDSSVVSLRRMSERGCVRIAKKAFDYAVKHRRKKVLAAHKANILKLGDGLFLSCAEKICKAYPSIEFDQCIIDALCMKLVMNPNQFDVLFMENLFGDIISDLCSGFVGGLGLVPGANIGDDYAVFEAVHGSAPDIANKDLANPTASIKSAVMMLEHLGEYNAAQRIDDALLRVLSDKHLRTKDLGGECGTKDFTRQVIKAL